MISVLPNDWSQRVSCTSCRNNCVRTTTIRFESTVLFIIVRRVPYEYYYRTPRPLRISLLRFECHEATVVDLFRSPNTRAYILSSSSWSWNFVLSRPYTRTNTRFRSRRAFFPNILVNDKSKLSFSAITITYACRSQSVCADEMLPSRRVTLRSECTSREQENNTNTTAADRNEIDERRKNSI